MGKRAERAWQKAADCEEHARRTSDGRLKAKFLKLRESWIRIGNDAQFDDEHKVVAERMKQSA